MPTPRSGSSSPARRGGGSSSSGSKSGWGGVVAAKKKQDDAKNRRNNSNAVYLDIKNKFILKDGETAMIQFITDEPVCVDGCTVPPNFDFYVSRKEVDKSCPLIEAGLKSTTKAAYKVLDFRGNWDKDKKKFKYDEPVEKYWLVSITVASQLYALIQRKDIVLSEVVFDVTRSGSDKTTTYNFELATTKGGKLEQPEDLSDYEESLPSLKKALKPLSREELDEVLGNDPGDDEKPKSRGRKWSEENDDDEDDKPKRKFSRRNRDEDEEDEPPRRSRGRGRNDEEDEDDEDEDDDRSSRRGRSSGGFKSNRGRDEDDEDDEDEKPRRKFSRRRNDDDEDDE